MTYLSALLQDPSVASVAPSSRYMADKVVEAVSPAKARVVVELGSAEGVITRRLLRALPPDARLLAVELNPAFSRALRRIRDRRLSALQGDARDLAADMSLLGLPRADAVVAGIPFSLLRPAERRRLLDSIWKTLRPGGRFAAYQLTPQLLPLLKERFRDVQVHFELRNLPPLFVLSGRR